MVRMVWQSESNGLATRFEWFGNVNQMVWQHGSNGMATQIKWCGNVD